MATSRKWKNFLCFMLIPAGLFLPFYLNGQLALLEKEAVPHTEKQKPVSAEEKQEEEDDIADVSPEEIISKLDSDAQKTKSWFSRERDNLLNFLIGSAASVNDAVFQLAFIRIARPQLRICDADGIDMGVHGDDVFSVSDATQNVTHLVDADFVKADFFHFLFDALDDFFFLTAFGRNGDHIAQEFRHVVAVFFGSLNNFRIHKVSFLS